MSDDAVSVQYESYPYPERDPRDEARRLLVGSPGHLLELNHYLFAGRRDFGRPFRALVAGGGTGDAAIMLAQQLADRAGEKDPVPGQVVYVDLSKASRAVAEARARARGLTNIAFHTLALEGIPDAGLGSFDYIDCCGVLHHLADPTAGLAALAAVLTPDGGMGLMVYGELGRTGVYHMQDALRILAAADPALEGGADRVALTRRVLKGLPATNWLARNAELGDHLTGSDAGLYDLLLHGRDRAYRVADVLDLVEGAGLRLSTFVDPLRYDPARLTTDPTLGRRMAGLDPAARWALAELLAGNLRKHVFYVVRAAHPGPVVADARDRTLVPVLHDIDGTALIAQARSKRPLTFRADGLAYKFQLPPLTAAVLGRVDGRRSVGAIEEELRAANASLTPAAFARQWDELFATLNGFGKLFLMAGRDP